MSIEPFIAFFFVNHLRKKLDTPELHEKWDRKMKTALIVIGVLFALQFGGGLQKVSIWVWHIIMGYILYLVYNEKEFQHARNIFFAIIPVYVVTVLNDIIHLLPDSISDSISGYVSFAFPVSIVWMIYMFVVSNKQQKALETEKKKRVEEEALNKVIAARKSELEVLVSQRTAEIMKQKEALEQTLEELQSTQAQLIQAEKMASLGELTAGIAHEIQNPLNFVNNFSEVNKELIEELRQEKAKSNDERDEELESNILNDIEQNLDKINYHGKRADAIVKSMLQHSSAGVGQKEETDINALADEYLRLSYHGLRSKDKSFNASLHTDLQEDIEKLNIVPQDIGRVLLNLFNNAFYALAEKKTANPEGYEPTLTLTTQKVNDKIEITIADNANGIPEKIIDKIFQPFFTTKPTGQGTGLGLSLSYDIIKAHGGEIRVDTKQGAGTTFKVILPVQ